MKLQKKNSRPLITIKPSNNHLRK